MQEMKKTQSPMAWVLGQTGDHGGQYVLSVVLAIIGVAFSLAPYFVVIGVVQGLMDGVKDFSFYLSRCLIMAALWLGRVVFHALSTATSHRATFAVLGEIRKKCMEKLTRMPLGTVLEQSSGALKNTLIERIDSIETTLAHIVPEFTANLLIPVIILIYIFVVDWRMGLASLATVPLGMFCYVFMMAGSAKFYQHTVIATKALNDTAVEYIGGIQVIKVFGKTKSSYERFVHDAYEAAHSFIDWMRASIIPFTFAMVIMPATMVSVLPIGGLLVKNGSLSARDFVTVIILSVGVITPIITMMSYSDNYLFNMTVRENIRIGRPSATDAEVEEAARQSGCHNFILGLEKGYDTLVGSSGGRLSGGERQRISIARAMVKAAPIVILDEATAYTDPENEAVIQRSVSRLTAGKTLIVIAHRLSTVVDADKIYVIKDGQIDDAGTHEELLNHHGLYEKMWNAHMEVKDNG